MYRRGYGKDEPIIFLKAIEHLGTSKADTAVIEDAYHAAKTAKNDGFVTIAVYDCYEEGRNELRETADFFIESYANTNEFLKFAKSI